MDRRLFFLLNRAQRALATYASRGLEAQLGVSVSQLTTLLYVQKHPGCSLTELAELLDMNKSAVTGLVQRMERAGTLRRKPDPQDGRASLLSATPKGEALRERAMPLVRKLNAEITEGFTEAEIETVLRFLNVVVQRFSTDKESP